jgi:hypothetical protein
MKIYIEPNKNFSAPFNYIIQLIKHHKKLALTIISKKDSADLIISNNGEASFPIAFHFYDDLEKGIYNHSSHFKEDCFIRTSNNEIDYLSTIFYMVNAVQEYESKDVDKFERFPFEKSYQFRFDNIEENLVETYINKFCQQIGIAKSEEGQSKIFISHDIDAVYGSLKHDSFWALKKGRIDLMFKIMLENVIQKPHWLNIDKIINITSEYDFQSTFFWIATQGKDHLNIHNSDYNINDPKIKAAIKLSSQKGFDNGIHKSTLEYNFKEEIEMLPMEVQANRYHFLKFKLPQAWQDIEEAGLSVDASLGFAARMGFRNSYGLPFQPYNFETKKAFNFIELPLQIMDGSLSVYMKIPKEKIAERIINFIEKNNTNCVLSLLWHNTEFTDYQFNGYLDIYKKILLYFHENNFKSISIEEVIKTYKND